MTTEVTGTSEPAQEAGDSTLMGGAVTPETPVQQPDQIGGDNGAAGLEAGLQAETAAAATDWRTGLPDDIKGNASLAKYQDIGALAKAYINAEKAIGADKIVMPDKHATAEDMKMIFNRLGLPTKEEEYKLNMPQVPLNDGELTEFKKAAFEAGIFPQQMQQLMEWYSVRQNNAEKAEAARYNELMEEQKVSLKKDWGEKFNQNLERIQHMTRKVSESLGEDQVNNFLSTKLNGTPLGNNPFMIRLFEHFSELMNLDELSEGVRPNALKPNEIQGKIDSIMGNLDHPYYKKEHPSHGAAVKEMQSYFERMNPVAKKTSLF